MLDRADQKTDDMLGLAGLVLPTVLLALWMVHTNTKYTHITLRININTNKARLFASYVR